jgi:hypothetical protein
MEEAINGFADLKAGTTLGLPQMISRFGGKRRSSEQQFNQALQR